MPPKIQQMWFDYMLEKGIIKRILEKEADANV